MFKKILVVDPEKRADIKAIISHPWFVETIPEPFEAPSDINMEPNIDFKIVYTMTQALKDWPAIKIVKALIGNRHNQLTATYYLLSEKKNLTEKKPWDFAEQERYAKELGFKLKPNGKLEEIENIEDDKDDNGKA